MIAIAPTDLDWFSRLRSAPTPAQVNFWTPTPWNVRGLSPGDRFYFLLKAPIRKIGGFGVFKGYENLTPQQAWDRFGDGNGVQDMTELAGRIGKYIAKRSEAGRDDANHQIGCIILTECQFFEDEAFIDLADVGVDFPKEVVKLKYFDDPIKVVTGDSPRYVALEPAAAGSAVWWVNQGKTYTVERNAGYIWAPQEGQVGGHSWSPPKCQLRATW